MLVADDVISSVILNIGSMKFLILSSLFCGSLSNLNEKSMNEKIYSDFFLSGFASALRLFLLSTWLDHTDDFFVYSALFFYSFAALLYFDGDSSVDFLSRFLIDFIFIIGGIG
jgi:hypothetical protein